MNISAPVEELFDWVDKIQSWLSANRAAKEALNTAMNPLFEQTGWKGEFGTTFQDAVTAKILSELKPILDAIDVFLGAVNAIIDAIQALIDAMSNPIGALTDAIF